MTSANEVSDEQDVDKSQTQSDIEQLIDCSDIVVQHMHEEQFDQSIGKTLERRFTISEVAEMVGRTPNGIRKAEAAEQLPPPEKNAQGRRVGYTLEGINAMREYFGIWPGRLDSEKAFIMSFQNFKGGVGKTTLCCHFSQYMAMRGYRVLIVDCDSQGSTTTTFGYRPDLDLQLEDTLMPFFSGDKQDLRYAVRPTYWDGLDLIPANLELYGAEYLFAAMSGEADSDWVSVLHEGLKTIQDDYDLIVLDAPPALGMIALNVVRSLDGLIVPTPPAMYDYHSTTTFFKMLLEVITEVGKSVGEPLDLDFVKILVSKYDSGKTAQEFIARMINQYYAGSVLRSPLVLSAEIDNASSNWQTVYELDRPTTSAKTYKRCINSFNSVFSEIELMVRASWQSHRESLSEEGHDFM